MAQNIYDEPRFFEGHSGLARLVGGFAGAPEWPALCETVGDVASNAVVDLGSGFGWFCRWAVGAGESAILGIDLSENMLARALAETTEWRVSYQRQDLDHLVLAVDAIDIAYSSLTLHYLAELDALFARVRAALPGREVRFLGRAPPLYHPLLAGFRDGRCRSRDAAAGPLSPRGHLCHGLACTRRSQAAPHRRDVRDRADRQWLRVHSADRTGPSPEQIESVPESAIELERPFFLLVSARCS